MHETRYLQGMTPMHQPAIQTSPNCIQFCQQKVLCNNKPFSNDQLHRILDMVYTDHTAFTGYLKFASEDCSQLFLFFFKGSPYASGRYTEGKPAIYTIQELARQLVTTDKTSLFVTLCETDPILLKSILLFLQKEPAIKAPTSLIDFEYIVQQIGEVGEHAMIALSRGNKYNYYFFKNGKCAQVHYADSEFKRPEKMTLEDEMLLYAFQPGEEIQAYIFRDMNTIVAEDSSQYDKDSLYELLTVGYLKNKRKSDQELSSKEELNDVEAMVKPPQQEPKLSHVVLSIESGPLTGAQFTVTLPCTIGRKECDLILEDRLVSRRHAELKFIQNTIIINDLLSKNGTKVNGEKITISPLAPNDLISIGPINLRILPGPL
jgi:hypothetical protein